MLLVAVSLSPWRSPLSPGACGTAQALSRRRAATEPLIAESVTGRLFTLLALSTSTNGRYHPVRRLPLTHVRVVSALAHGRHASLNDSQRLARRDRIAFFGFLDGLTPVLGHRCHAADSPVQLEAIGVHPRYVGFNNDLFLVLSSSRGASPPSRSRRPFHSDRGAW